MRAPPSQPVTVRLRSRCLAGGLLLCWGLAPGASALRAQEAPRTFLQTLEPHKPIYFAHSWITNRAGTEVGYQDEEVILQFSFRKRLVSHLHFAYTQRSFWQVYDEANSRPIRANDYNPEFFLEYERRWGLDMVRFGLWEHESNGGQDAYDQDGNPVNLSRTWNRVYVFAEKRVGGSLSFAVKAWTITDQADDEATSFGADNPDIQDYLGSGELYARLGLAGAGLALMFRKGRRSGTGTYRLEGWYGYDRLTGREGHTFALFIQAFSGFGDSLIDYDRKIERISLGILFQ